MPPFFQPCPNNFTTRGINFRSTALSDEEHPVINSTKSVLHHTTLWFPSFVSVKTSFKFRLVLFQRTALRVVLLFHFSSQNTPKFSLFHQCLWKNGQNCFLLHSLPKKIMCTCCSLEHLKWLFLFQFIVLTVNASNTFRIAHLHLLIRLSKSSYQRRKSFILCCPCWFHQKIEQEIQDKSLTEYSTEDKR